jgi:hypothetical protein
MNLYPLLALLCFAYLGLCLWIAVKKPDAIWNMGKLEVMKKLMGEKGTQIFIIIFGVIIGGVGVWLMTL